ncbi:YcxB family protein [Oceanobacillus picturae]|uniref:YcxB family protein n=1 Tax=Oceanobacillus picturae TaxID=171693 RepID=UPI003629244E
MIATFSITEEDLIAQQKNAIKNTKFHRKSRIMQLIVFIIFVIFTLVVYGFSTSTNDLLFGLALCLILAPVVWKSYEVAIIRRYKRDIVKQHKNKKGTFTLTLSEEELIKESNNLTEKIQWDDLKEFKEDETRYFLYITDLHAITIKKEPDNLSEEEIKKYQAFIKRKVSA